jgi:uncharacterized membrane protein YhaH (DUF805 family)
MDGLEKKNQTHILPLALVVVGIILLLSNFELLNQRVWDTLIKLWPLILVYIGVDILTKNKPKIRTIATVALLALTVFLVLFFSEQQLPYFR